MTTRQPLSPVTGLKRTSTLPPPPPRTVRRIAPTPDSSTRESSTTARGSAQPHHAAPDQGSPDQISGTADTVRAISLSLPLPLVKALKDRARTDRITHADVLMDAVTAQRSDLPTLLQEIKPQTHDDALFTRHHRNHTTPTYVALSLRMLSKNVTALDELTQHYAADSRSQLCAAALTGYLAA